MNKKEFFEKLIKLIKWLLPKVLFLAKEIYDCLYVIIYMSSIILGTAIVGCIVAVIYVRIILYLSDHGYIYLTYWRTLFLIAAPVMIYCRLYRYFTGGG